MMEIKPNEMILIYNSNDLQDRQTLGYAQCLRYHHVKEWDLYYHNLTALQYEQLLLHMEISVHEMINYHADDYRKNYGGSDLDRDGLLKAMTKNPGIIKTPIVVHRDHAYFIKSPFELIKLDLLLRRTKGKPL